MAENKHLVCLLLTEEQEQVLEGIFVWHGWEFERAGPHEVPQPADDRRQEEGSIEVATDVAPAPLPPVPPPIPSHHEGNEECPHCLCAPCITSNRFRQGWWPRGNSPPHLVNRSLRLQLYKNFWALLYNHGVWLDPRYKQRKEQAIKLDPRMKRFKWQSKRDIMPNCVIDQIRDWHPKTDGEEYVGHKWTQ